MAEKTKPWNHWWFWALLIPVGGVFIPIAEYLPLRDWWFWAITIPIGYKLIKDYRTRALKGGQAELLKLQAEIQTLRAQLVKEKFERPAVEEQDLELIERQSHSQGIVVIMFSDIEGFTPFVEYHGDQVAYERLKHHNQIFRSSIRRYNGSEVKHLGDGFMINFSSAREALLCACDIQNQLAEISSEDLPLRVRIGIHAGEPIQEQSDFVGRTVNLAQRIMSQANGGQIYISEVVKTLVGPVKGYQYVEQGTRRLEGISEPQNLFEFHPIEALATPLDTVVDQRLEALEKRIKKEDDP